MQNLFSHVNPAFYLNAFTLGKKICDIWFKKWYFYDFFYVIAYKDTFIYIYLD